MTARPIPRSCSSSEPLKGWLSIACAALIAALCALSGPALAQTGDGSEPPTNDGSQSDSNAKVAEDSDEEIEAELVEIQLLDAENIPEYDRIRTPASPAFSVLGVAPSQIQKPTTPRDFAMSLSNSMQESDDLTIPKDVALEFAPYWWFRQGKLTFNDYMNAGFASTLLRNLSISLGTISRDMAVIDPTGMQTGINTESRLAVGIRTQLYTGKSAADVCAGRVQDKAAALAKEFIKNTSDTELQALSKLVVARAERATWERLVPMLKKLDKAKKKLKAARAGAKGPHDSPAAMEAAGKAVEAALKDEKAAKQALVDMRERLQKRAQAAAKSVKEAEAALAKVRAEHKAKKSSGADKSKPTLKTGKKSKKKSAKKSASKKAKEVLEAEQDLERRKGRKAASEKAFEVAKQGATMTVADVQNKIDDAKLAENSANQAREEASEKRKKAERSGMYEQRLKQIVELCKDASAARRGWIVSIAGASAWLFPDSLFASGQLHTAAGWLTVAHTWNQGTTLAGVVRGAWSRTDDSTDELGLVFDAGVRVIQAHNKFAVSTELIARTLTDDFVGVRAAIVGEYMVSKGSWLSLSFGKDFSNDDAIFTLANLQWGLGGEAKLRE